MGLGMSYSDILEGESMYNINYKITQRKQKACNLVMSHFSNFYVLLDPYDFSTIFKLCIVMLTVYIFVFGILSLFFHLVRYPFTNLLNFLCERVTNCMNSKTIFFFWKLLQGLTQRK